LQNTREFSGYVYHQQNWFSSPLSWRAQTYKMEDGRRWRYKEEQRIVPISPSAPSSSPRVKNCVPNYQRCIPFEQTRRNMVKLPHQHRCRSALSPHRSTLSLHRSTSKIVSQLALSVGYLALSVQKCEKNDAQPWILALSAEKCERNGAQPWILLLSLEMLSSYLQIWLFFLLSSLVDHFFGLRQKASYH